MSNISFATNSKNDLFLGADGNLSMVTDENAIAQDCKSAMQTQYGEMVFQPQSGLPNLTDLWISKHLIQWEAAARQTLLSVPGVIGLVSLTYNITDDALNYSAIIKTAFSRSLTVLAVLTVPKAGA